MQNAAAQPSYEDLQRENILLREGRQELKRLLALSQENVALLRFELDQLKRIVYGTKSERFEPVNRRPNGPRRSARLGSPFVRCFHRIFRATVLSLSRT